MRLLQRLDRLADRETDRIFGPLGVIPGWQGPVRNKRWRLILAYRALRGYELSWDKAQEPLWNSTRSIGGELYTWRGKWVRNIPDPSSS
jgi:hypothetical protein